MAAAPDYEKEAIRTRDEFLFCVEAVDWKQVKQNDGVTVYTRPSEDLKGSIYRTEVIMDCSPEMLITMLSPVKPYRQQWDKLLEKLDILSEFGENSYLIRHTTKPALKGILSARDSVDVVTVGEKNDYYYVSAASVSDPAYPPSSKIVRTFQYPAGYVVYKMPNDPSSSKWVMIFHADLNMNNVANFMVDMAKPALMIEKINSLRKGLANVTVAPQELSSLRRSPTLALCQ